MSRPLVSVLTPTWGRLDELVGAVENVKEQTYRPLEHVVVSDGPDDGLRQWCAAREAVSAWDGLARVRLRYVELGRNWSTYLPDSFVAAPITVAMLLARGEFQTWLADDERMEPEHIDELVAALDASGAAFAFSRVRLWWADGRSAIIGTDPPTLGQITNVLYRTELLKDGLYPFGAGMTSDWSCISRWQSRGARHAFVDRLTLSHRVDH